VFERIRERCGDKMRWVIKRGVLYSCILGFFAFSLASSLSGLPISIQLEVVNQVQINPYENRFFIIHYFWTDLIIPLKFFHQTRSSTSSLLHLLY